MIDKLAVQTDEVALPGLDGANPLGFLAALGTLVTVCGAGEMSARLRWQIGQTWTPVIDGVSTTQSASFSDIVARGLRGRDVPPDADAKREEAQRAFEAAGKVVKQKLDEIKKHGLSRDERKRAHEVEVRPLEEERDRRRETWLKALADAVPRPELALGKRIDCKDREYRQHADSFRKDAGAGTVECEALDLLAAFGCDACLQKKSDAIEPTPFQFITGSGHQFFLETVRELIEKVSAARVEKTLFEPWTYSDERLSMRWDPIEDKRYALLESDPGPEGARTVWMANLLGYRSLVLFPSAPRNRVLGVTAWADRNDEKLFTWPMWEFPASPDVIRSLLQLRELIADEPDGSVLRARGIATVFRARRIKFPPTGSNYKLNFSPARAIWGRGNSPDA